MAEFVEANGRKRGLREALGFRLGGGRGKILFQLREQPMTLTAIAAANGIDASYATIVVDKLESLGLVERTAHPEDRRRKLVRLTAAGHSAAATADAVLHEPPAAMERLSAAELSQLDRLLSRLLAPET
jgi:DNA-binding MarR family transcriptional regulator